MRNQAIQGTYQNKSSTPSIPEIPLSNDKATSNVNQPPTHPLNQKPFSSSSPPIILEEKNPLVIPSTSPLPIQTQFPSIGPSVNTLYHVVSSPSSQ